MCNPTDIQHKIHKRTGNGELIADFLADTVEGKYADAKFHHRLEAAKHLMKYGFSEEQAANAIGLSRAGGNPEGQGEDETPVQSPHSPGETCLPLRSMSLSQNREQGVRVRGNEIATPISYLDILNYQIAHLIRHETAEGHTLVEFLIHIMTGKDRPFTPRKFRIKPADRMAAARELLRRGFGDLGTRRKQSDSTDEANAYDTLHTDLAKRMREYSERGTDTVRFLLEVMSDPDPDQEFTIHHRISAAQELLRRGWDTNYDNIKPKHLQDYWRDKESSRLSIGQKKTQAGLSTSIDDYDNYDDTDYEAIAQEMREEEDRDVNSKPLRFQETVPSSRHSRESRNPEGQSEATTKPPLPQGEGWGEGAENTTEAQPNIALDDSRKAIIKEFQEAMANGDHRAALRAKAKFIGRQVAGDLQPYVAPDPNLQPHNRLFDKEEQAKFDEEPPPPIAPTGYPDPEMQIAEAATNGTSVICAPPAEKLRAPAIRSP